MFVNTYCEGDVLFGSRRLALLWLPPIFHSPSLHVVGDRLTWVWACDLTFLSWANGNARQHPVPPALTSNLDFVRAYVCGTHNITDDNWQTAMPEPGAALSGSVVTDSVGLHDAFCGPAWPGIEQCAESGGYYDAEGKSKLLRDETFDPQAHRAMLRKQEWAARKKRPAS